MNSCIYKEKYYYAPSVAKDYNTENKIREASDNRLLKCDVCGNTLIYCRGPKITPYFRHLKNAEQCEYKKFCNNKKISSDFVKIRSEITKIILENYNEVIQEKRISKNHWCDLAIKIHESYIPIELVNNYMSSKNYNKIKKKYITWKGKWPVFVIINNKTLETELDANTIERPQFYDYYKLLIQYNDIRKEITIYSLENGNIEYKKYLLKDFKFENLDKIKLQLAKQNLKKFRSSNANIIDNFKTQKTNKKGIENLMNLRILLNRKEKPNAAENSKKEKYKIAEKNNIYKAKTKETVQNNKIISETNADHIIQSTLTKNELQKLFDLYFNNRMRKFAADSLYKEWENPKSRVLMKEFIIDKKQNDNKYYIKIKCQFPIFIRDTKGDFEL